MSSLLQDIRFAIRSLLRNRGFAVVALLTIALGIGANTAMFSVVDGILLRPLPYAQPEQLVRLHQAGADGLTDAPFSFVDFEDWRERTHSFASMTAYFSSNEILTDRGDPVELQSAFVTEDFFDVLGGPVQLGRPLLEEDAREGHRAAVISDGLWRSRFAADPGAIGSSLMLAGGVYTVVGVARADFRYPTPDTDVWAPYSVLTAEQIGPRVRDSRHLEGVARLAPGISPEQARADLDAVATQLAAEYPETNAGWTTATVVPLRQAIVGEVDRALVVVLGMVGFILLIGCANLANLLLARGSARSREFAVRSAVGAGQLRIVRQLLTESLVLALIGGVLGLVVALWGVRAILALSAATLPRVEDIGVDARVIGFGLLLILLTGLLFGLLPALRAVSTARHDDLRGARGAVGSGGRGLRSALVVAEVTLAVVLVIGAGLMARSFLELRGVDAGFDADRVLAVSLRLNLSGVAEADVVGHIDRRRQEILDRLGALPGVTGVGAVNALPLLTERWEVFEFRRADGSGTPDGSPLRADGSYVSAGYLTTMGVPLLRGEPLPDRLASGAPVPFLVNEAAAGRFWPGRDAVGQTVRAPWGQAVVAGVVGNVRQLGLDQESPPAVYLPQVIGPRILNSFIVRTAGDPLLLAGPIRQIIHEVDPNQPLRGITPLREVMGESIARDRFFAVLFGLFGGLALLLAAVGIYGVIAYSVSQRTQEIGVRMALGADIGDIVRMVIGNGFLMVATGIAIGTGAALVLTGVLRNQLYEVSPTDPLTFAAVAALLAAVGVAASYIPARRATRVDPMIALRSE